MAQRLLGVILRLLVEQYGHLGHVVGVRPDQRYMGCRMVRHRLPSILLLDHRAIV